MNNIKICDICGITSKTKHVNWSNKTECFLCAKHKWQIYKYGKITDPTPITIDDANEIEIKNDYAEITLRNRKHEIVAKALIDTEDVERCKNIKWSYNDITGYAYYKNKKNIPLHMFILEHYNKENNVVDHINRNKLDNRKNNLRIVNRSENRKNSNIKGAYYRKGKWEVTIGRYGQYFYVGSFNTYEEAIQKREEKIKELDSNIELIKKYNKLKSKSSTGIYPVNDKWMAVIHKHGKQISIGRFNTSEEAYAAREKYLNKQY